MGGVGEFGLGLGQRGGRVTRTVASLAALGLLFAACAVPVRVETLGPDFTERTIVRMRGNVLPTPVHGIGAIELNPERIEHPLEPMAYALLVEVRAEGLRIRDGESLRLVLDGDTLRFERDPDVESWPALDPTVREQARYPVSDSVMVRLAAAEEVTVAVQGAARWEVRRLAGEPHERVRRWVQVYGVVAPTPPPP